MTATRDDIDSAEEASGACCIDYVSHAPREESDGRDLYIRCIKHGRKEKLADNYYAPNPTDTQRGE